MQKGCMDIDFLASGVVGAGVGQQWGGMSSPRLMFTPDSFASKYGPGPKIKANFENLRLCAELGGGGFVGRHFVPGANGRLPRPAPTWCWGWLNLMGRAGNGLLAESGRGYQRGEFVLGMGDPVFVPFDHGYFAFIYDATKLANPHAVCKRLLTTPNYR